MLEKGAGAYRAERRIALILRVPAGVVSCKGLRAKRVAPLLEVMNGPRLVAGALLTVLLGAALLALSPAFLVLGMLPDAAAPAEIAKVLPAAKAQLNSRYGFRWPAGYYRFLATETRTSDNLLILHFEYRVYPFIGASSAYLASRCTPLSKMDPRDMSGGWGPESQSELNHLRSPAQQPCP